MNDYDPYSPFAVEKLVKSYASFAMAHRCSQRYDFAVVTLCVYSDQNHYYLVYADVVLDAVVLAAAVVLALTVH